jgi:hypothetical protein
MDRNWHHRLEEKDVENQLSILLHALRASRRRQVIQLLDDGKADTTVSTRWVARRIAASENGIPREQVSGQIYKNVYNALSQSHLPTLAEAEVIVYDPQRQMLEKGPSFRVCALLLNLNTPAVEAFYGQYSDFDEL